MVLFLVSRKLKLFCRYSVDALLDDLLSKHLMEKKMYIGQKIRVMHHKLKFGFLIFIREKLSIAC